MKQRGDHNDKFNYYRARQGEEPEFYESDAHYYLWSARLRATPGRIALLEVLQEEQSPISAEDLIAELSKEISRAGIYRTLESLVEAGLIRRINIGKDHALYEISVGRKHHHHAVCTSCGRIEDIQGCHASELLKKAFRSSKDFSRIDDHSLEFFGVCKKCTIK